jgi:hypothetical protein
MPESAGVAPSFGSAFIPPQPAAANVAKKAANRIRARVARSTIHHSMSAAGDLRGGFVARARYWASFSLKIW